MEPWSVALVQSLVVTYSVAVPGEPDKGTDHETPSETISAFLKTQGKRNASGERWIRGDVPLEYLWVAGNRHWRVLSSRGTPRVFLRSPTSQPPLNFVLHTLYLPVAIFHLV